MAKLVRKPKKKVEIAEWMPSFTDMVTLLMCFFVLLFSMADIDPSKAQAISDYFAPSTQTDAGKQSLMDLTGSGLLELSTVSTNMRERVRIVIEVENIFGQLSTEIKTYFADTPFVNAVEVERIDNDIIIVLSEGEHGEIWFESGRADLTDAARTELVKVLELIENYGDNISLKIVGHTDNIPISTVRFPSNYELSFARALSVRHYFAGLGTTLDIEITGRGDEQPVADNDTEENRAKNRRVEIVITREGNQRR
jgi:chemotaxis protein MotB